MLQADNLVYGESHNMTLIVNDVNISAISLHNDGLGSYENGSVEDKEYVTALFNGSWCDLFVWFEDYGNSPNPLDILTVPYDTNVFSLNGDGILFFGIWLNASTPLTEVYLEIHSTSTDSPLATSFALTSDLNYTIISYRRNPAVELSHVPIGNHFLQFEVQYNGLKGDFDLNIKTTPEDIQKVETICFLDDLNVSPSQFLNFDYSTEKITFIQSVFPWLYAYSDPQSYCLNFTAPRKFTLRIDQNSREQVDFILIDSQIEDVSITRSEYYDNPCYEIDFEFESESRILLGLTLHDKTWFLRPTIIQLEDTPPTIREAYTNPSSSFDGRFIDVNNPTVQSWAKQVVQNESNAYLIAHSFFENLTRSLEYNETYSSEYASATLQNRIGVCRHFARAYAALCMATNLSARTVVGTAFSFLNETWKKNHEWNEVYFPGYGWVTVDVTWDEFELLSNKHVLSTYWNYIEGTLNVTKPSIHLLTEARNASQATLKTLINLVHTKSGSNNVDDFEMLLDQAKTLGNNGYVHNALLKISEAYTSGMKEAPETSIPIFEIATGVLLVIVLNMFIYILGLRRRVARIRRDSKT